MACSIKSYSEVRCREKTWHRHLVSYVARQLGPPSKDPAGYADSRQPGERLYNFWKLPHVAKTSRFWETEDFGARAPRKQKTQADPLP